MLKINYIYIKNNLFVPNIYKTYIGLSEKKPAILHTIF